jgi:hypothetical protein
MRDADLGNFAQQRRERRSMEFDPALCRWTATRRVILVNLEAADLNFEIHPDGLYACEGVSKHA